MLSFRNSRSLHARQRPSKFILPVELFVGRHRKSRSIHAWRLVADEGRPTEPWRASTWILKHADKAVRAPGFKASNSPHLAPPTPQNAEVLADGHHAPSVRLNYAACSSLPWARTVTRCARSKWPFYATLKRSDPSAKLTRCTIPVGHKSGLVFVGNFFRFLRAWPFGWSLRPRLTPPPPFLAADHFTPAARPR